jgi:hypothetical protein
VRLDAKSLVRLMYQVFTLSSPGIDSQKLLNLRTKYVQCLAAHSMYTVAFAYENKQNTREIAADGHAFVIDYERDHSPRFQTRDSQQCRK